MTNEIIDTHVHVWDFNEAEYDWLKGDTSILNRTYHITELEQERKQAGVTKGVLVQAANNPEDTEWMLKVAADTTWMTGVVGWLPLTDPVLTHRLLAENYASNTYFKGVRHLIHNEPDPAWLLKDECVESLKIIEQYHLPYDLVGVTPIHIKTALKLAEKVPGLKMVFDHLNQPPVLSGEKYGIWGQLMKEASGHKNFYAKISGLGLTAGKIDEPTNLILEPYIHFILQAFTEDRCFCGGDWPVCLLAGSYLQTWQTYETILKRLLDDTAREKVFVEMQLNFIGYDLLDVNLQPFFKPPYVYIETAIKKYIRQVAQFYTE